ncbi:MAG TPA: fibronectin type III domain-containing protein [Terriglobales bacterium]|nr:fibronectin type III domain-containing protein [Terriglobales bacterium]
MPPTLNLAKPVSDLKALRVADQVTLTWTVPTETTDGATFRHPGKTRICRSFDLPKMSSCDAAATLEPPGKGEHSRTTSVNLGSTSGQPAAYETFAVEVDNDSGRNAGLSNQVQVPAVQVSVLDGAPEFKMTSTAVVFTTKFVEHGVGVEQALELRRKDPNAQREIAVAQSPIQVVADGEQARLEVRDETFAWDQTYSYYVAIVGTERMPNGPEVSFDGAISAPMTVVTHDVFPPAVPSGLQAVYTGNLPGQQPAIDLTWNPDLERDLAGYFVYRRTQQEPASAAVRLNSEPLETPAYHDTAIQPGNVYIYSVSAVDHHQNESARSEEASEQVPK